MCHTAVWTVSYYAARGAKCKGEILASANMKEKNHPSHHDTADWPTKCNLWSPAEGKRALKHKVLPLLRWEESVSVSVTEIALHYCKMHSAVKPQLKNKHVHTC